MWARRIHQFCRYIVECGRCCKWARRTIKFRLFLLCIKQRQETYYSCGATAAKWEAKEKRSSVLPSNICQRCMRDAYALRREQDYRALPCTHTYHTYTIHTWCYFQGRGQVRCRTHSRMHKTAQVRHNGKLNECELKMDSSKIVLCSPSLRRTRKTPEAKDINITPERKQSWIFLRIERCARCNM